MLYLSVILEIDWRMIVIKLLIQEKKDFWNSVHSLMNASIHWRSGMSLYEDDSVCLHHEKLFLAQYESIQYFCVDPRSIHKKNIS